MPSPTISADPGRSAIWPETNTNPPAQIAWEYGAPWNGAGAASVRIASCSGTASTLRSGTARLGERDAQRLEHRLQHVLRVVAGDQPDVEGDAGALGEAAEEIGDEV